MNEKQIAEIEARKNAATQGTWATEWNWERLDAYVIRGWAETPEKIGETFNDIMPQVDADRLFIDNAKTDIDALLAEVRRLQAVVEKYADHDNWLYALDEDKIKAVYADIWSPNENGYAIAEACLREDGEG